MADKNKGLARVKELYLGRDKRAKELRSEGKKVLGYVCLFAPREIMEAADILPYGLRGDLKEPITSAHAYIEPFGCPYVRNLFDQDLKGKNDFLDGLVMSHSCDMVQRMYGIWTYNHKPAFQCFVNVPHTTYSWSGEFYKRELDFFKAKMERFSGNAITENKLRNIIKLYNANRALLRTLYQYRKQNPPLISGVEIVETLVAGTGIPVVEFNTLLEQVIDEVKNRSKHSPGSKARLLFYGSICDDTAFVELLEQTGTNVVIDDTCIGTRRFLYNVPETPDPIQGLAMLYLDRFRCPRTLRVATKERFAYLLGLAREYEANGVIFYVYSYCDPHKLDVPDAKSYLEKAGLPVLVIDDDYTLSNKSGIKTRVQAFAEMIG